MNKNTVAVLIAILILLMMTTCGCQRKAGNEFSSVPSESDVLETVMETIPGVVNIDEEINNPFENVTEKTEDIDIDNVDRENERNGDEVMEESSAVKDPTKATEPKATEPKETEPEPTEPNPTESTSVVEETEYERYLAMSGDEQKAFMESFGSIEAFFEWLNTAKAEHEALKPDIAIEDGKIDLGKVVDGGK